MIGIDLTRISRFENIDLQRLSDKLGQNMHTPMEAAKVWACLEALTKAEGKKFNAKNIKLVFKTGCAPVVEDKNINVDKNQELSSNYTLSLTHEGDYIAVVAIRT
jgi:phosphopantetheinyl transferase (holo-ACP synthase)